MIRVGWYKGGVKPRLPFCLFSSGCLAVAAASPLRGEPPAPAPAPTDDAIRQVLRQRIDERKRGVAIVVGWVDEHGSRVVGYGHTQRDGGNAVDGKTMFEIGSVSKVFTSLLLALAVEKGEAKLDDPLAKFLPPGVKAPTRGGKQITLLDLATHRSGLPRVMIGYPPKNVEDPYADFTLEQMDAFLSGYTLTREIGAEYEYSNYGVAMLGNALARRAGKTYEQLLVERICQPLGLKSTTITLSGDEKSRLASPYNEDLSPAKNWNAGVFAGAAGIRSDVDDMLVFVSAQLGLAPTSLQPAMQNTQQARNSAGGPTMDIGLGWHIDRSQPTPVGWHNGGTGGYRSYFGLDPAHRRGVVVLSNTANGVDNIGVNLLYPPKARTAITIKPEVGDRYVGRYEVVPEFILTFSREGDHYYLQASGQGRNEVFPETETDFFLKGVNAQISFVKDDAGRVTALVLHQGGDQNAKRLP